MIFCGDLDGDKLTNTFTLLPNGATIGICAGKREIFDTCMYYKSVGSQDLQILSVVKSCLDAWQ